MGIFTGLKDHAIGTRDKLLQYFQLKQVIDSTTGEFTNAVPIIGEVDSATLTAAIEAVETAVEKLEGGYSVVIGKPSGGTFVTAYSTSTKIVCTGMPTIHPVLLSEDIEKIMVVHLDNTTTLYLREDYAMIVDGTGAPTFVLSVTDATFVATDTFVIYTNVSLVANPNYAEDSPHTSGDNGTQVLGVRNDAYTALTDTDGDYSALSLDQYGQIQVNQNMIRDAVVSIGSGNNDSGTQKVTIATDDINLAAINIAIAAINTASGTIDDAALVNGSRQAQLRYIGIAVELSRVLLTSLDTKEGTTGEAADLEGTRAAQLRAIGDALLATLTIGGDVAHDAVNSGNPIQNGGEATDTQIAQVANGDRTKQMFSRSGEVISKAHDYSLSSDKVIEQAPDWAHRKTETYSEDYLVATGAGQVYWLIPTDTYSIGNIYTRVVGDNATDDTTIKVWATNDPNITQPVTQALLASEDWDDVTTDLTGAASHNPTGSNDNKYTWFLDTYIVTEFICVEYDVTAIGGTDINFTGIAKFTK